MTRREAADLLRSHLAGVFPTPDSMRCTTVPAGHVEKLRAAVAILGQDDASKDGTEAATPAYWRGHADGQGKAGELMMELLSLDPIAAQRELMRAQELVPGYADKVLRVGSAIVAMRGRRR